MTQKTVKIIYWIGAVVIAIRFGISGIAELTRRGMVWDPTEALGYPPYFIYLLGAAKIIGVVALLVAGKWSQLKEWVFAGIVFNLIFAFCSKLIVFGFPKGTDVVGILSFIPVLVTYLAFRRLTDLPATTGLTDLQAKTGN